MTDDEVREMGRKVGVNAPVGFEDWKIFKLSLGFFKWKEKKQLTEQQVKIFGEGFKS